MLKLLISVVLLQCILQSTSGLYFHMRANERKCFIQETPEDTQVIVHYKVEKEDPSSEGTMPVSPGKGMHVDIRDSDGKIVLSRVYDSEARLLFTTFWPGDHHICLQPKGSDWFTGVLRVHLEIKVGEQTVDYANFRRKQQMDNLQLRVLQLMNQAEDIFKNQNYQRFREERFRQTSESVFFTIKYCCVAQVVVLVILLAIQYHLLFRRSSLYLEYCQLFKEEELKRVSKYTEGPLENKTNNKFP
nr:transmembrane emp24 domain-containing protein eca-like [Drosophila takahashii]